MTVSTALTGARRSTAALALDPLPASKVQLCPLQFAELDKHNLALAAVPSGLSAPIKGRSIVFETVRGARARVGTRRTTPRRKWGPCILR